jgi:hypothetical protein
MEIFLTSHSYSRGVMRTRRTWMTLVIAGFVLVLGFELAARYLLGPNRIELGEGHPYLLTTRWHQVGDYARFVTLDDDTGCWATAVAQIGHYHGLQPVGTISYRVSEGTPVEVDLDSFDFDHAAFVDEIDSDTPPTSRDQVAGYIYAVAAILYTDFGASGYLEHETLVERIEDHLGCTVSFHRYEKARFLAEKAEVTALVRTEIEARRPLMLYFDDGKDFGHAAVIDGFYETGDSIFVHLNMGWGGRHDGWYDLFDRLFGVRDDLQNRFLIAIAPPGTND